MAASISFQRLYRASRREAEPRFGACLPAKTEVRLPHTRFQLAINGRFPQVPVQPGSLPYGHGTRSYVERDVDRPMWADLDADSSFQPKGGHAISV